MAKGDELGEARRDPLRELPRAAHADLPLDVGEPRALLALEVVDHQLAERAEPGLERDVARVGREEALQRELEDGVLLERLGLGAARHEAVRVDELRFGEGVADDLVREALEDVGLRVLLGLVEERDDATMLMNEDFGDARHGDRKDAPECART